MGGVALEKYWPYLGRFISYEKSQDRKQFSIKACCNYVHLSFFGIEIEKY